MYIQLSQQYRDYDKLRISEVHFYENTDLTPKKFSFKYQVYKMNGTQINSLFDKTISITNVDTIEQIISRTQDSSMSIVNAVTKVLLEYIINQQIEQGTIEVD